MASSSRAKKVVARNGVPGYLKGESFYPKSNFLITRVICCVKVGSENGWLIKIKGINQDDER